MSHGFLLAQISDDPRPQRALTGPNAPRRSRANIKIASFDGTRLRYAGTIGTGFSAGIAKALPGLDRDVAPPIAGLRVNGAVWMSPDLRAEIAHRGKRRPASGGMRDLN